MIRLMTIFIFFTLCVSASDALVCKVVNEDEIMKIKCVYKTVRKSYDRNISIAWTSPSTPQDDRLKTILLPANHGSVYDFRYFDGRADGSWTISATDESSGEVTTIEFVKEDLGEASSMSAPCKEAMSGQPPAAE